VVGEAGPGMDRGNAEGLPGSPTEDVVDELLEKDFQIEKDLRCFFSVSAGGAGAV